jgi:hypothetical protein
MKDARENEDVEREWWRGLAGGKSGRRNECERRNG